MLNTKGFAGPIELDPESSRLLTEILFYLFLGVVGLILVIVLWAVYLYKKLIKHDESKKLLRINSIVSLLVGLFIIFMFVLPNL